MSFSNLEHLETPIALQFRQVARIMQQRHALQNTRSAFYVQIGSFDAHGDSALGWTGTMLSDTNAALQCFVNDMKTQGIWNDVTIVSSSEFGRTLTSNGMGSDHAWGGNHFIAGGSGKTLILTFPLNVVLEIFEHMICSPWFLSVAGSKIHGQYPDDVSESSPLNLGRGRLIPTTSWEGLWLGISEWMGVEVDQINTVLPNLGSFTNNVFGKDDLYNV